MPHVLQSQCDPTKYMSLLYFCKAENMTHYKFKCPLFCFLKGNVFLYPVHTTISSNSDWLEAENLVNSQVMKKQSGYIGRLQQKQSSITISIISFTSQQNRCSLDHLINHKPAHCWPLLRFFSWTHEQRIYVACNKNQSHKCLQ